MNEEPAQRPTPRRTRTTHPERRTTTVTSRVIASLGPSRENGIELNMMMYAIALAVVLQINNVVGAPGANLERAQQEVTRLYRRIGVDVTWIASDAPHAAARRAIRVVLVADEAGDLRRRHTPVMGSAVVTDQGTQIAYVYYRQIESQARQYDLSVAMILASAIAHEVAHLLLPSAHHSLAGLMRACWARD